MNGDGLHGPGRRALGLAAHLVRLMTAVAGMLFPASAGAQGFAGLGTGAEGFAIPDPSYRLAFPADHGPHDMFRIEWWYLTATLSGDDGRDYGAQWTLFRSALTPGEAEGWQSPQVWMGHAAVTTPDSHHFAERLARGGIGQAGVRAVPFAAWVDDWEMTGPGDLSALTLSARGGDFSFALDLSATGPMVLHGRHGYSVKSPQGQASHYYSQPAYGVSGTLNLPDGPVQVTGNGWLDREWSSQPLSDDQVGWDWFSLGFTDGTRLMGFALRGDGPVFTSGTWISADGTVRPLPHGALGMSPLDHATVAGRQVPIRWRLTLPGEDLDIEVQALNPLSWMGTTIPYWEGPVTVSGSHGGRGYLEMTGY